MGKVIDTDNKVYRESDVPKNPVGLFSRRASSGARLGLEYLQDSQRAIDEDIPQQVFNPSRYYRNIRA